MEPAESIVELWLQNQGYFTRNDVEVGTRGKEIDFLAFNPGTGKRLQVESSVSVNPFGTLRPFGAVRHSKLSLPERVRLLYEKKFVGSLNEKTYELRDHSIEDKVRESFYGKDYGKWFVLGEQKEGPEKIRKEFAKHGVEVHYMDEVLGGIKLKGAPKNSTARLLQILEKYTSEVSKRSILMPGQTYQKGKGCGRGNHKYEDHKSYVKCAICGSSKTLSK